MACRQLFLREKMCACYNSLLLRTLTEIVQHRSVKSRFCGNKSSRHTTRLMASRSIGSTRALLRYRVRKPHPPCGVALVDPSNSNSYQLFCLVCEVGGSQPIPSSATMASRNKGGPSFDSNGAVATPFDRRGATPLILANCRNPTRGGATWLESKNTVRLRQSCRKTDQPRSRPSSMTRTAMA